MARTKKDETPTITTTKTLGIAPEEENLTEEETQAEVDKDVPTISVTPLGKEEKLVKIKPNFNGRPFIGVKYYTFVKGQEVNVPQHVKDILFEQGGLMAL